MILVGGFQMNLIIRQVKSDDLLAVTEVERACFPEAEAAPKEVLEERISIFPDCFFVAEIDKKIVGFINGSVTNDSVIHDELFSDTSLHLPDGRYQTIFGLDVVPKYRKKGIAAELMKHLIQQAKEAGRTGVILTCKERLIHYYASFGYKNKGISSSTHGGAVWYDMILNFE